jgi:predicted 2-oxoglutarate/Fe(II)-dependent dioxygenase YbiX
MANSIFYEELTKGCGRWNSSYGGSRDPVGYDSAKTTTDSALLPTRAGEETRPIVLKNMLSVAECRELVAELSSSTATPTPVLRAGRDNLEPMVRFSESFTPQGDRHLVALKRVEHAAQTNWHVGGSDPGSISAAHYFRYPTGGFVAPHRDRSPNQDDPREVQRRQASLVLFLNSQDTPDGFEGGSLLIYVPQLDGPTITHTIRAEAGTLVMFDPGLMHEVTRVRHGSRFTLVAWLISCS